MISRRVFLSTLTGVSLGLSGCLSATSTSSRDADVLVGPNSRLRFEPDRLPISNGEVVTWLFESIGHNVSCVPSDTDVASLPDGATPFSSYKGQGKFQTMERGETFSHRFELPGTYEYLCIPHQSAGMVGSVEVEP